MSMRTDSGVCRYCGSVMVVSALMKLDGTGVDAYACPECAPDVSAKTDGGDA